MTVIDLAPIVDNLIVPLLTPILMGVATWALHRVATYAHFQVSDGQRQVVATAIDNGLAYAQKMLAGKEQVTAGDQVAVALNYVLPKVPGALKALGVTPEHLSQIITAKLPA